MNKFNSLKIGILIIFIFIIGLIFRPGFTPKLSGPNSISELKEININGTKQWLLIRGEDKNKPVLLFVHGGPGTGMIGFFRKYQKILEKEFIVVQWDQRGAGLSNIDNSQYKLLSKELFVEDGHEVTKFLKKEFKRDKIYLVGHSWGTALAYILAQRYPEDYYAYAGIGHMSKNGETLAYNATLEKAIALNNKEAIKELKLLGAPPYKSVPKVEGMLHESDDVDLGGMLVRYKWSNVLGGDAIYLNMNKLVTKDLLFSTEYNLIDSYRWLKNKEKSINSSYKDCNRDIDLYNEGTSFKIPIYFLLGRDDLLTVSSGAEELFNTLSTPEKKLIWYDAAHEIPWEQTKQYQEDLISLFLK